ncbi:hypothetical protein DFJ58DRAFT_779191 [Suillus subalutaceus]|uniref:uncharacterized protein n=1 Tax=Suillus subalutaceus TaxID=48586 RepID=UPI001B87F0FA|nr:uncharacterized protein DFJ58DRAFT_779191 [Suillus subalutaceus]KAG1860297.1 hypothetical protein DFJ58DRAFT_779191 [Suillus subalutaceus]
MRFCLVLAAAVALTASISAVNAQEEGGCPFFCFTHWECRSGVVEMDVMHDVVGRLVKRWDARHWGWNKDFGGVRSEIWGDHAVAI